MLQAVRDDVAVAQAQPRVQPQPTVTVGSRFNGPPGMGNGGFTAGMLSRFFEGGVEVTVRRPVPLDRALAVDQKPEHVAIWHEYALIASARPVKVDVAVPEPVSFAYAQEAMRTSRLHAEHVFPGCFVCGTQRPDGLHIIPGAVAGRSDILAAPWVPGAEFAENGVIAPEFVWGALDCPGGIAAVYDDPRRIVLGRIAGEVLAPVLPEQRYVATAWRTGDEGRKHFAGTALFTDRGELVARAVSTWFDL